MGLLLRDRYYNMQEIVTHNIEAVFDLILDVGEVDTDFHKNNYQHIYIF